MANVLSDTKRQQVLALGRLGWPLRRIEDVTGVRRETASAYLKAAGVAIRPSGGWGRRPVAKPAKEASTDPAAAPTANPANAPSTESPATTWPPRPGRSPQASACEPYRDLIRAARDHGRNAMAIWPDLVGQHGFAAGYASVQRFVKTLHAATPAAHPVIVTAPGEEAQVDYGEGAMVRDPTTGKYRRTRLFVLTLGYSRKCVRLVTWKSSTRIWAELHEEAFRRLGGVPTTIVPDYVARHIVEVLCPRSICGRDAGRRGRCGAAVPGWTHNHRGPQRMVSCPSGRKEIVMLDRYFLRPETVDRIRSSWIGDGIDRYVGWLAEQGYAARNVFHRVPVLRHFGEFARAHGATTVAELPAHLDAFVAQWVKDRGVSRQGPRGQQKLASEARGPIEQMLRLVLPDFAGRGRSRRALPFESSAPGFFPYLRDERGLRATSIEHYRHFLTRFACYLGRIGVQDLGTLAPTVVSAFVTDQSPSLGRTSMRDLCGTLRVFLRYLQREGVVRTDLGATVESPQAYRLVSIPRSITWDEVRRMLDAVDRRSGAGKRDYAILLLLVTYGLRAREVTALTLNDLDWRRERLRVPERKAGHSTAYPLSPLVGEAVLDYVQHGRPTTTDRHVFFRVLAPPTPLTGGAIASRAAHYLHKAGIVVPRAGSHTLRHTCVQRLVDAEFSLKQIGDYVGHRSPASTEIYTKVAVDTLREVALGDGETIL
jgi:integrase/recombinase XerD